MKTFEYKTLEIKPEGKWIAKFDTNSMDAQINELGRQGWELVVITPKTIVNGTLEFYFYTFKRQIN